MFASPRLRSFTATALAALILSIPSASLAQSSVPPPAPPADVVVADLPNDSGGSLEVTWTPSPDGLRPGGILGYRVMRSDGGPMAEVAMVSPTTVNYRDGRVTDDTAYTYQIVAVGPGGEGQSPASASAMSEPNWFNKKRGNILFLMILVCGSIIWFIERARAGEKLYIRKIAGMDAVTEAVGRATEMGKPVLYISGIQDMDDVQTVAGITILGSISKMIAEYETSLMMPTSRSMVMSTARETVKEAYLSAGRPDAYRDDSIYYVTDEQFGFVAHVDGVMLRRKPAACFYLGAFFAESLILAETGNSIGAIQIAGTAMPTQLPFFVAACDYTLIGEELFAASAYLSQDEKILGSLKGQDFGKLIAMIFIVIGTVFSTLSAFTDAPLVNGVNNFVYELWSGSTE
ncbi:MAG: fibronectin type III domain-containing protein [Gemmatimonadetes bacterium]|nr:fibronectin type III domain-containing protein [Gemmatimonadota bacterium]